jgi:hypothetical protein
MMYFEKLKILNADNHALLMKDPLNKSSKITILYNYYFLINIISKFLCIYYKIIF